MTTADLDVPQPRTQHQGVRQTTGELTPEAYADIWDRVKSRTMVPQHAVLFAAVQAVGVAEAGIPGPSSNAESGVVVVAWPSWLSDTRWAKSGDRSDGERWPPSDRAWHSCRSSDPLGYSVTAAARPDVRPCRVHRGHRAHRAVLCLEDHRVVHGPR